MTDATETPSGRPSTYTQSIADHICTELATGKSLRKICDADDMPCLSTVMLWVAKGNRGDEQNKAFSEQYACAREAQVELFNDELVDIADEGNTFEATGEEGVTFDNVQRAKLRIETRKWAMSKMLPKKYGEKQHIALDVTNVPTTEQDKQLIAAYVGKTDDTAGS